MFDFLGDAAGAVSTIVGVGGGVVGVAGGVFGFLKRNQFKKIVGEAFQFFRKYREAKSEKSDGGTSITEKEFDSLVNEFEDVVREAAGLFGR